MPPTTTLPAIRIPQLTRPYGEELPEWAEYAFDQIMHSFRSMGTRLFTVERTLEVFGIGEVAGVAGEAGIAAGMLIHRTVNGACFRAKATDATRFCNCVCTESTGASGGRVATVGPGTNVDILVTNTTTAASRLYLSATPGYATYDPNGDTGATVFQQVGYGFEPRRTDAKCKSMFLPTTFIV